jgi:hypothetical protein
MAATKMATSESTQPNRRGPVLKVTQYDLVTSTLLASIIGLVVAFVSLTVVWVTNRLSTPENVVPLELLELPGGFEDGVINETLKLDSPEDVIRDPSLADAPAEENEVEETLENVVELADQATNQADQTFELDVRSVGKAGSATGTGRRALGLGPGESGLPRDERWFVRFSGRGSLRDYALQLDFFGIELGAVIDGRKLVYLSQLSAERPRTRSTNSGKGEQRLHMIWQGGTRRDADIELFRNAGVNITTELIFHFYPPKTESLLARLERDFKKRPVDQIRRTYFIVRRANKGYRFIVSRQTVFR